MAKIKTITVVNPIDEYAAAATANPANAQAQANLGWGHYSRDNLDEAMRQFEKALQLNRDNIDAQYGLSLALKKAGKTDLAVAALERAAELASKIEDRERQQMLLRLLHGHVNVIKTGDWKIGSELWHKK